MESETVEDIVSENQINGCDDSSKNDAIFSSRSPVCDAIDKSQVPDQSHVADSENEGVTGKDEEKQVESKELQGETTGVEENASTMPDNDERLMVVDEWEDEEFKKEEKRRREIKEDNPNVDEKNILAMPSLATISYNLSREERTLSIYPVAMADINREEFARVRDIPTCINCQVHFLRPLGDETTWAGFAVLHFISSADASNAVEKLQQIGEHLTVKMESNPENCENLLGKLLYVKNVPQGTTVDQMREIFPDTKNIVMEFPREKSSSSSSSRREDSSSSNGSHHREGYAYVICNTTEACDELAAKYLTLRPELNGRRLKVYMYREPSRQVPACLLTLSERKVLLLHSEKVSLELEKAKEDPEAKPPKHLKEEHETCERVLDRDNRTRVFLKLPTPSLEELNALGDRLPDLDEKDTEWLLRRTRVKETREHSSSDRHSSSRHRDHGREHRSRDRDYHSREKDRDRDRDRERERDRERDRDRHRSSKEELPRKRTNDEISSSHKSEVKEERESVATGGEESTDRTSPAAVNRSEPAVNSSADDCDVKPSAAKHARLDDDASEDGQTMYSDNIHHESADIDGSPVRGPVLADSSD